MELHPTSCIMLPSNIFSRLPLGSLRPYHLQIYPSAECLKHHLLSVDVCHCAFMYAYDSVSDASFSITYPTSRICQPETLCVLGKCYKPFTFCIHWINVRCTITSPCMMLQFLKQYSLPELRPECCKYHFLCSQIPVLLPA